MPVVYMCAKKMRNCTIRLKILKILKIFKNTENIEYIENMVNNESADLW